MTRGQKAKGKLDDIKYLLKTGQIDYEQAKTDSKEYFKILNEEMEKISKKFGKKHRAVTFISFMR